MKQEPKTYLWFNDVIDKDVMRTTTQVMLEEGAKAQTKLCVVERKLLNFSSFNMNDPRYGALKIEEKITRPLMTSYTRAYAAPYPPRCKPLKPKADLPDPNFFRLPKNDFDFKTGQNYKFLDDHFENVSEDRKKINFFRQMRNQSFIL